MPKPIEKNQFLEHIKNSPVYAKNMHLFVEEEKVKKRSKYGNNKVELDGHLFDSKKECVHYQHLKVRQLIGEISDLELQPVFELVPKTLKHRKMEYKADFRYIDCQTGETKVVDVKSAATKKLRTYINKKKMMYEKFKIEIVEV